MSAMRTLKEDSPNTFEGSFTKDLIFSKLWLCSELGKAMAKFDKNNFDTAIILGSWYGNIVPILNLHPIQIQQLILVDIDAGCINTSRRLLSQHGSIRFINGDANRLRYRLKNPSSVLFINTSCNDMDDLGWYGKIPPDAIVCLQSRSDHESLEEMDGKYPMSATAFLGSRSFRDPTESYHRHMKIGKK